MELPFAFLTAGKVFLVEENLLLQLKGFKIASCKPVTSVKCPIEYRAKKSTTHKLWQIMKYLNRRDDNIMTKLWPWNPIKLVSNEFKAF